MDRDWVATFVVYLIVACSGCGERPEANFTRTVQTPPIEHFANIVSDAQRVETYRLYVGMDDTDMAAEARSKTNQRIGQYQVKYRGPDLDKQGMEKLASILTDSSLYSTDVPGCTFSPIVAYRAFNSGAATDVLVCFKCGQLSWGKPESIHKDFASFHKSARSNDLIQLTKATFPMDSVIASVPLAD